MIARIAISVIAKASEPKNLIRGIEVKAIIGDGISFFKYLKNFFFKSVTRVTELNLKGLIKYAQW